MQPADPIVRTRFAPSPTSFLHIGGARTALFNWLFARHHGGQFLLRIEDTDRARSTQPAIDAIQDGLSWLGLDWDQGPTIQSDDLAPYTESMRSLASRGLAYPCELTRTQIEQAASAPNEGDTETPFPRSLRPALAPQPFTDSGTNWRLAVEPGSITFTDARAGPQTFNPAREIGDFVIWTKRRCPAYQLAVVVDDAAQRVTQIARTCFSRCAASASVPGNAPNNPSINTSATLNPRDISQPPTRHFLRV
mgnify:CR=1 FL=1